MRAITRDEVYWNYFTIAGYLPSEQEIQNYVGKDYDFAVEDIKRYFANRGAAYYQYRTVTDAQIKSLTDQIANLGDRPTTAQLKALQDAIIEANKQRDDAKVAFAPVIDKVAAVRRFDSLQRWMNAIDFAANHADGTGAEATFDAKIAANKRDFEARFARAQWLMVQQRWTDALDELLEILMRDKAWSEELARKTYIAILDIIEPPKPKVADGQIPPDDPTVATYRRRLSSVILS